MRSLSVLQARCAESEETQEPGAADGKGQVVLLPRGGCFEVGPRGRPTVWGTGLGRLA